MTFQQFLLILRARFWVIAGVLAGVVFAALVVSLLLPKKYTAETSLVIDGKSDPILGAMLPAQMAPGYLATQVDIITSDRVAQRVVALTKMDQVPTVQEQWREATDGVGSVQVWLADSLKKSLDVKPSRESSVINLSYSGSDPQFVAAMANAFARAYIDTTLELKVEPARQYAQWFNDRTGGLRTELAAAQKRLSDYEQEHRIIASDGRLDVETARLAELNSQLVAVQGQRADSRSRQSQAGSAESLPEVMGNPLISGLKADIARLDAQRGQMLGRYGTNHPEIARVDAELSSLRQRVASETQRVVSSLGTTTRISAAREAEIAASVEEQKARVLELKAHRDQIAVLQRDVENAQRAYDLVTQRLAQTNLESQTQQTNVAVLTPATPPLVHSSPKMRLNLLLAVFVGTLLGVGIALALELFDQRVRGEDDLAGLAGVPVLGAVPTLASARGPGLFRRRAAA
ncbi:chain length determinant protein EpsF [Thauera sinica]|uniref:Chain length determinant protein EpsF n=1 Tax=Thauera sinica TaxID=2665146 RepID=A0ABW1ANF4_9RHOO|nr:chain length determinant protein EpsF [Thauera sp. K11]ATE60541.1 chain length determinant protein EpsF [Thauera sp. K11]